MNAMTTTVTAFPLVATAGPGNPVSAATGPDRSSAAHATRSMRLADRFVAADAFARHESSARPYFDLVGSEAL